MSTWQKSTAAEFRCLLTSMGQRKVPSNTDGFDDEFEVLKAVDQRVRSNVDEFYTASLGSNMCKNRYQDVMPNEGTRVVLEPSTIRGDGGEYINANYVDGRRLFNVPFVYITTQAPIRSTLVDFWRMVWENNSAFIVMLCKEVEGGKSKSIRYFPDGEGGYMTCGPITVLLEAENRREETIFRRILLRTEDGQERRVFHMQHTGWPDQSIPKSSAGLMEMIYALGKSALSTRTPIVVHCSGGVGRTGVFIAMHVALALFQTERPVSIPRIVQYLKYCRTGMVQRKDQYLFLYYAVLREMEKMVWAFEQKNGGSAAANAALIKAQLERSNESVARRASRYTPSLEEQALVSEPPLMNKSRLFPHVVDGSGAAGGATDHHIVRSSSGGQLFRGGVGVGRPPLNPEDERQRRELEALAAGRQRGPQRADEGMSYTRTASGHAAAQRRPSEPAAAMDSSYIVRAAPHPSLARDESTFAAQPQPSAGDQGRTNHQQFPSAVGGEGGGAGMPPHRSVSRRGSATHPTTEGAASSSYGARNPVQEQLALLQSQNQRRRGTVAPISTSGGGWSGHNSTVNTPNKNGPPLLHRTNTGGGGRLNGSLLVSAASLNSQPPTNEVRTANTSSAATTSRPKEDWAPYAMPPPPTPAPSVALRSSGGVGGNLFSSFSFEPSSDGMSSALSPRTPQQSTSNNNNNNNNKSNNAFADNESRGAGYSSPTALPPPVEPAPESALQVPRDEHRNPPQASSSISSPRSGLVAKLVGGGQPFSSAVRPSPYGNSGSSISNSNGLQPTTAANPLPSSVPPSSRVADGATSASPTQRRPQRYFFTPDDEEERDPVPSASSPSPAPAPRPQQASGVAPASAATTANASDSISSSVKKRDKNLL